MDEIDVIKITVAFIAALASNVIPILELDNDDDKEDLKLKELLIILIRIIILTYSISFDWPVEMCVTISIIISIISKIIPDKEDEEEGNNVNTKFTIHKNLLKEEKDE